MASVYYKKVWAGWTVLWRYGWGLIMSFYTLSAQRTLWSLPWETDGFLNCLDFVIMWSLDSVAPGFKLHTTNQYLMRNYQATGQDLGVIRSKERTHTWPSCSAPGLNMVTSCTYVVPALVLVHERPHHAEALLFQPCQGHGGSPRG